MNANERALRHSLGIPDSAKSVLIFEQSAHCDWDWVATFDGYYFPPGGGGHQAVQTTLNQAVDYIGAGITSQLPYTYVYCEVAYLQKFWNDPAVTPQQKADMLSYVQSGSFLFASGGITSAENLTLHTEAFIRNYLLGRQWLMQTFGATASNQMWIPDDFGHDAQLPALLRAMGFAGAGFERIPAQWGAYDNNCSAGAGSPSAPSVWLKSQVGYDFLWQANDGSVIQAHWLEGEYCQGNSLGTPPTASISNIPPLITANTTPVMPTTYMFVPIDCDFTAPYSNGPEIVAQWNATPVPAGVQSTYLVWGSFDAFMQLVGAATTNEDGSSSLQTLYPNSSGTLPPFVPHPVYSGCYASKPFIKNSHFQVVRTLLFAESMQLILQSLGQSSTQWQSAAEFAYATLEAAWNSIAPSTHHDYIPGTAPNGTSSCSPSVDVYDGEQVPLLQQALIQAQTTQTYVVSQLASAIGTSLDNAVAVFNGLGFARTAIADVAVPPAGGPFVSSSADGKTWYPTQDDGNGGLLLQADAGSLGYTTMALGTTVSTADTGLTATPGDASVVLSNNAISATITVDGITSLSAPGGASILGDTGNQLRFYHDWGNIYRFGNEIPCSYPPKGTFGWDQSLTWDSGATITITETGSLRVTAVVSGTINSAPFTVQYQLYATDTALRISVTGSAPSGYSVMTRFPFTGNAASLTYATTAHWDTQGPRQYFAGPMPGEQITFEPTHEYVAALDANGNALGAVYHFASPAWGIDSGYALLGCLLRNVPGNQNAACADDPGTYTVSYAIALPGAASMRNAALDVNNPLVAAAVTPGGGPLPSSMSIASTSDSNALITAAKAGTVSPTQMILRLYQPTNSALSVTVTLDATIASGYQANSVLVANAVDALEQPSSQNLDLSTTATSVSLNLPFAITTIALGP